jgi:Beta-ketoacyl synthase, N-terminal domain
MNDGLEVQRWSFWSPETRSPVEWRDHWRQPNARSGAAQAAGDGVAPVHRRRMSALSKQALQVALEVRGDTDPDFLVFCSQHGELPRTMELLHSIVAGTELSPAAFSQSVHNSSAGLYTIIAKSRAAATSLASGASTFAYGWIEADAYLRAHAAGSVLLVMSEDLLPTEYLPYSSQRSCRYALALMLGAAQRQGITLDAAEPGANEELPMAPLFAAWWSSAARDLRITADGQGWAWERHGA